MIFDQRGVRYALGLHALVLSSLTVPFATAATAQTCASYSSFDGHPIGLAVGASFSETSNSVFGGVHAGVHGVFANAAVVGQRADEPNKLSFLAPLSIGFQVPISARGRIELCPSFTFAHPNLGWGIAAGFIAVEQRSFRVIPSISLGGLYSRTTTTDSLGIVRPFSDVWGRIRIKLGIVFRNRVSVHYFLTTPFVDQKDVMATGFVMRVNVP